MALILGFQRERERESRRGGESEYKLERHQQEKWKFLIHPKIIKIKIEKYNMIKGEMRLFKKKKLK